MCLTKFSAAERFATFLVLLLELLLVGAIVRLMHIEGHRHFLPVYCFIVAGYAIHTWLPLRHRLAFFALLSITCVLFVLGLTNGCKLLGIGSALIGICYLPIGFGTQLAMLAMTGTALVFARVWFPLPFWPVLGSMFMFRLILYVFDTRRETLKPPRASSLSYFFLLPNVCFPLFPVVDYKTFRDTWYDEDEWEIYQRGVAWIVRGLIHLLLYRYIKMHLVPDTEELVDVPHMAWFMCMNYALYLQVSGQFHLITGLLHLFGFNLPRTHHLFFLASSFSDIWRRINIYWKDFMAKIFFYPIFFAVRRRGTTVGPAIILGVFGVFICTWLLHSWQTFWLLGRFPLTANDALLWLGVGGCVAVNAALDARRTSNSSRKAWLIALSVSVRTVTMFLLVSLFWACWTKPGFFYSIKGVMNRSGALHGLFVVLFWIGTAAAIGAVLKLLKDWVSSKNWKLSTLDFSSSAKIHIAGLGVVLVFLSPWSESLFDANVVKKIAEFRFDPAAIEDAEKRLQGYYEDLNMAAIQAGPLLSSFTPETETRRAQAFGFYKVSRVADAYQGVELIPNVKTELDGSPFSVNQFGMRDRTTITRKKSPAMIRIALVGSSIVMGYGVSDDEVFSRVFETRLNNERIDLNHRFELLNFGVGKQWAPHRLTTIQRRVVKFEPDAIYYFAHQDEFQELASHPAHLIAQGLELPSQYFKEIAIKAEITSGMAPGAILSRLQRYETELLDAVYRTIVDECRKRRVVPVWVYLPIPSSELDQTKAKLIP
ncbi:MAG TPA: hypothetical protein VM260_18780, partial [Pirellula sp.]|nr:hypothetical protein [Pirellula sp.]